MPFLSSFRLMYSTIESISIEFSSRLRAFTFFRYIFISSSHLSSTSWFFILKLAVRSFLEIYIVVDMYLTFRSWVNRITTFQVLSSRCLSLNIVGLNVAISSAKTLLKQFSVTCRSKCLLVKWFSMTYFPNVSRKCFIYNKKRGKSFLSFLFLLGWKTGLEPATFRTTI